MKPREKKNCTDIDKKIERGNKKVGLITAILGLQAYIEIVYEEEVLGRIVVNDLYGSNVYKVESGIVTITCKADKMRECCSYIKGLLCKLYGFDKEKLQIKQDTILGFRYTVLYQNFEVPRYYRLNDNSSLYIKWNEVRRK